MRALSFAGSEPESDRQAGEVAQPRAVAARARPGQLQGAAVARHPQAGAADEEAGQPGSRLQTCKCSDVILKWGIISLCCRIRNGSRGCRTLRPSTSRKRTRCVPFKSVRPEIVFSPGFRLNRRPLAVHQLLNELSNMQLSVSEHQQGSQRLQQEMRRQLQEREQTIRAQREQVGTRSPPQPDYTQEGK